MRSYSIGLGCLIGLLLFLIGDVQVNNGMRLTLERLKDPSSNSSLVTTTNSWWEVDDLNVLTMHAHQLNQVDATEWPWQKLYGSQITEIVIEPRVSAQGSIKALFAHLPNLKRIIGLQNLDTQAVSDFSQLFAEDINLEVLDVSHLDTSNALNMNSMFFNCRKLPVLDLNNFVMTSQTDTGSMLAHMSHLWQLTLGKQVMFNNNPQLSPAPGDNRRVSTGDNYNHTAFWQEVATGKPTAPQGGIWSPKLIVGHYQSNAIHKSATFVWDQRWWIVQKQVLTIYQHDIKIDAQIKEDWPWQAQFHGSTQKVIIKPQVQVQGSLFGMFAGFTKVQSYEGLSNLDTSRVTNMAQMFRDNSSVATLDLATFDTSQVEDFSEMFSGMTTLNKLDLQNFDMRQALRSAAMLAATPQLWRITLGKYNQFPEDPHLHPAPAHQMTFPENPHYCSANSNWQEVGDGSDYQPGGIELSAAAIINQYQMGNDQVRTYVWTSQPVGHLALVAVPQTLNFGEVVSTSIQKVVMSREEQTFIVEDTRFQREQMPAWQVLATASPLESTIVPGQVLQGAVLTYQAQSLIFPQQVVVHQAQSQLNQSQYRWSQEPTTGIQLSLDLIKTPPLSEHYQTQITYELRETL